MPILVSLCNTQQPEQPVLGVLDPETAEFAPLGLAQDLPACSGVTGVVVTPEHVSAALEMVEEAPASNGAVLAILSARDLKLRAIHRLAGARDIHSLWWHDSCLFVVSTGTDELIERTLRGDEIVAERLVWRPEPGVPRGRASSEQRLRVAGAAHHLAAWSQSGRALVISLSGIDSRRGRRFGDRRRA